MRGRKRILAALAALAAIGAAVEWAIRRTSMEQRRVDVERALSAALGREVRFGGDFHLEFLPRPRLEATDVSVANGPGRPSEHLLTISTLRLEVALWPLLERRLELIGLDIDGAELHLEPGPDGNFDALPPLGPLTGEGAAPASGLSVRIDHVDLRNVQVDWADAASGATSALRLVALEIETAPDDDPMTWSAKGELQGGTFDLAGSGGSLRSLLHPNGPWPLSLEGHAGEAEVHVSGRISDPLALQGLDLDVRVEVPELGHLVAPPASAPKLGRGHLQAHLVDPGGERRLEHVALESERGAPLRLRLEGSVLRLSDPSGIELAGEIEIDKVRRLEPLAGRPLPEGSLHTKFRLSDRDGTLGIEGDAHLRTRDGAISLDLTGGFGDVVAREGLDARLVLAARDLAALGRAASLDAPLPAVGPVTGSARLRGSSGAFGVQDVQLEAGRRGGNWLLLQGGVQSVDPLAGVSLDASFTAPTLAELARELRLARRLPEVGPLDGSLRLRDPGGTLGLERFELRGGAPGTLRVELRGALADLRQVDSLDASGRLEARDLGLLGALFGVDLPALGPLTYEGRVRGSDERFESDGSAVLGQTRIDGTASLALAGRPRPRIEADLRSERVRFEDLGLARPGAGPRAERGFSLADRRPLPFEKLHLVDLQLSLEAAELTSASGIEVRDGRASLTLEDGDLDLRELRFAYQGGQVAGTLRVDARPREPELGLRVDATALDLPSVWEVFGRPPKEAGSGQLDLALDLSSRGGSPAALRERLGGRIALALREWSAAASWSRRFLLDLTKAFLGPANRAVDPVGCLEGAIAFASGVGTIETLVLTGPRASVSGRGRIDVGRERFDLELVPDVRKPGLLSIAAAVRVTGPFASPSFQPVPLDVVTSAVGSVVRAALAPAKLATGGARHMLGSAGDFLAPVHGAIRYASGEREKGAPHECALPAQPSGAAQTR